MCYFGTHFSDFILSVSREINWMAQILIDATSAAADKASKRIYANHLTLIYQDIVVQVML